MSGIDERVIRADSVLTEMAIAIDTLAYARRLRDAGFSEAQAEGQAQALAAAMTDTLATKQDLHEMDARIDARFAKVDALRRCLRFCRRRRRGPRQAALIRAPISSSRLSR